MTLLQTDPQVRPIEPASTGRLRVLFAKHELGYPRSMGHDLRCYNVMRALARQGHVVGLATVESASPEALEGLQLAWCGTLNPEQYRSAPLPPLPWLQKRFATYFGVTPAQMLALAAAARAFQADVVVGMGPDTPAYMAAVDDIPRVWYTGDEWVSHYSSLCKLGDVRTWSQLTAAAIWGLYERVFAPTLERIWVVSGEEQRQMRRWAAADNVDVLQNGVDAEYFAPVEVEERPHTAAFWGRLDFAPNLQGLQWFCDDIWPALRQQFPDAQFQIIGFNPGEQAYRLARVPGVVLTPNLKDLRTTVGEHAVVVMPFHSGGGVKNKLLEAAAMAKAVVCTSFACGGLRGNPPLKVVDTREDWIAAITHLWADTAARRRLGTQARNWVVREHSWARTAHDGLATLQKTVRVEGERLHRDGEEPTPQAPSPAPMRLLFARHHLTFPRSYGHDVCLYNIMRALTSQGHQVGLATVEPPSPRALEGLELAWCGTLHPEQYRSAPLPALPWLQKRFASYLGVTPQQMLALAAAARTFQADMIIGMGPDIPVYMAAATDIRRVWYTGDEWVSHYSSLCKPGDPRTWKHLLAAAIWGTYQRVFAATLERIWVVSDEEQRQMRRWAGVNYVDVLQNGVDAQYFAPAGLQERPHTAAFWGRLDFQPNLQGLQWFCDAIWPALRRQFPDAQFQIVGFNPGEDAYRLARVPGVVLTPNLEDLRATVGQQAVVVMPFHSGGGVKNKLLEAAAMGKAVVCTSLACGGLRGNPPLRVVNTREDWVAAIAELWGDAAARRRLGTEARKWVVHEHSWERTAKQAVAALSRTRVLR